MLDIFDMLTNATIRIYDLRGEMPKDKCWCVEITDENGDVCEVSANSLEAALDLAYDEAVTVGEE